MAEPLFSDPCRPGQAELATVLDGMSDAVVTTDAGYRVIGWNRAAAEIYGWTLDEVRGRHISQVIQARWASAEARDASLVALETTGRWTGEVVHTHKDGRPLHIQATVAVQRGADGEIYGAIAVNRNLTPQHAAEEALAQASARLAEVQRTDALGQLAGSVAHDFNNLLAILSGHAELALGEILPGHPARRSIEIMYGAVERGAVLTQQLLSFGRRDQLDVTVLDLVALVQGIDEVLRRLVGSANTLVLELPAEPVLVRASVGELQQALINLCSNSREAMPQPGTVRVRVERRGPKIAELVVEDDGEGMPDAVRARATEPFFTTRAPGRGTGLGLAVVTRVVSRYRGELQLDSVVGIGTRVAIRLPIAEEVEPAAGRDRSASRSLRVLYAEDNDMVREVTTALLELLGHRVLAVADGEEVIATARTAEFDLLVTDVAMARVSGPDAASALRVTRPKLPVVYVSGFPLSEGEVEGWPPGVWRMKPVSLDELRAAIREAMGG